MNGKDWRGIWGAIPFLLSVLLRVSETLILPGQWANTSWTMG